MVILEKNPLQQNSEQEVFMVLGESQAPFRSRQSKIRIVVAELYFRAVTESINNLLTYCAQSLPGQKECDNAIRRIQQLRPLLDNCAVPINQRTYYESLDAVLDSSRVSQNERS